MSRMLALTVAIAAFAAGVSAASTWSGPPEILSVALDGTGVRSLAVGAHPIGAQDGRIAFCRSGSGWCTGAASRST